MNYRILGTGITAFIAFIVIGISTNFVTLKNAQAQTSPDRQEIENIIREYLLENPEILFEVQQAYEEKQQSELSERQKEFIETRQDFLKSSDFQIEFGNPNAEITVVEFFDYNCAFCQRAASDMQKLVSDDDNIRFVLKEFPVLGQGSLEASQVSMAFSTLVPEKHAEFHLKLLDMDGPKDGQRAIELAVELGADEAELSRLIEDPKLIDTIREVYEVADGLGITGTPSYVVGDQVIFGAVGYQEILSAIAEQIQ